MPGFSWSQGRTQGRMRTRGVADGGTTDGRTKFEGLYFRILTDGRTKLEDSYFHIFMWAGGRRNNERTDGAWLLLVARTDAGTDADAWGGGRRNNGRTDEI